MLKSKIFDYIKKYLDSYLFNFDENKLAMSYLSGKIQLQDLHLRQDMANRLIDSFGIPLNLKAGSISTVSVSFSLLSFWSSPLEVEIDEIYLLFGSSIAYRSNDESYIEENQDDLLNTSYDSTNCFNVFEHEMKIKQGTTGVGTQINSGNSQFQDQNLNAESGDIKIAETARFLSQSDHHRDRLIDEENQVQNVRLIFRNLQLTIRKLHIRFEEDYYSRFLNKVFSFGISIQELGIYSSEVNSNISSAADYFQSQKFQKGQQNRNFQQFWKGNIDQKKYPQVGGSDSVNLLMKELVASSCQIYFDNSGQILMPFQIVEQAELSGDPLAVFSQIPIALIQKQMSTIFLQGENQGAFLTNQYVVLEPCEIQMHIFSYRQADFSRLYQFLGNKMQDNNIQQGYGNQKDLRIDKQSSWMKNKNNGPNQNQQQMQFLQAYKKIHQEQFNFFRNEFALKFFVGPMNNNQNFKQSAGQSVQVQGITLNITPQLLEGVQYLNDYFDNYSIAQDLKQYRPQRKPISRSQLLNITKREIQTEQFMRKRRNIVRDWLFFVVWYVRLKKLLEIHKASQGSPSINQFLAAKFRVQNGFNGSLLKSPMQDPTQLTTLEFGLVSPKIQIKMFNSNEQMKNYFSVCQNNNQQQLGNRQINQVVGKQQKQNISKPMRVAPITINLHSISILHFSSLIDNNITKSLQIRQIEVFLARINKQIEQLNVLKVENQSNQKQMNKKYGEVNSNSFNSKFVSFFTGQESRYNNSFKNNNINGVNDKNLPLNLLSQEDQRNASFMDNTEIFKYRQSQVFDNVVQNDFLLETDRNGAYRESIQQNQQIPVKEQPQSIWGSVFNAIKDLFNMNEKPSQNDKQDNDPRSTDGMPTNVRASMHRSVGGNFNSIDYEKQNISPNSGQKSRPSLLQNVELMRINKDQTPFMNPSPILQAKNLDRNRRQANQYAEEFNIPPEEEIYFSNFSQMLPFGQLINKYSCYSMDYKDINQIWPVLQNNQALQQIPIVEILQYPILKTIQNQQPDQNNNFFLSAFHSLQQNQYLQIKCQIDKTIEISYCPQDILEVLINSNFQNTDVYPKENIIPRKSDLYPPRSFLSPASHNESFNLGIRPNIPGNKGMTYKNFTQSINVNNKMDFGMHMKEKNQVNCSFAVEYFVVLKKIQKSLQQAYIPQVHSKYQNNQNRIIPDIIDFKPLWAIRQNMHQNYQKERPKNIKISKKPKTMQEKVKDAFSQSKIVNNKFNETIKVKIIDQGYNLQKSLEMKLNSDSEYENKFEEGENIEEEGEHFNEHTLSFIKCKPSLLQNKKKDENQIISSLASRASLSVVSNGGEFKNHNSQGGVGLSERYLFDIIYQFERQLIGLPYQSPSSKMSLKAQKNVLVDIQIQINVPIEIQVLIKANIEKNQANQAVNQLAYVSACRMRIQPQPPISLKRTQFLSAISICGIDFESSNRFRVMQVFAKQLYDSLTSIMRHPMMQEHFQGEILYKALKNKLNKNIQKRQNRITPQSLYNALPTPQNMLLNGFDGGAPEMQSKKLNGPKMNQNQLTRNQTQLNIQQNVKVDLGLNGTKILNQRQNESLGEPYNNAIRPGGVSSKRGAMFMGSTTSKQPKINKTGPFQKKKVNQMEDISVDRMAVGDSDQNCLTVDDDLDADMKYRSMESCEQQLDKKQKNVVAVNAYLNLIVHT